MAVVCIVYDLHRPGQAWSEMDEAIKGLNQNGGRAFNTTWFLATSMTTDRIYDAISHVADANDKLMVFTATAPGALRGLDQQWQAWLKEHL